ncbi:MAG TPA: hypothetical protein VIL72_10125 [Beijerinckiaceae bacterium]
MVRMAMIAAAALAAAAAYAQDPRPEAGADGARDGRFSMTPAGDGFLRLDTRTGAVSHCRTNGNGLQCRAGADERAALDAEIERLGKENAELKRKLAQATDQAPGARLRNALPTDDEVNRAMGWMEQFMRRMMRVMREEAPKDERL